MADFKSDYPMTAVYNDRESAERAYDELRRQGYSDSDINLVMSDDTRNRYFASDHNATDSALADKAMSNVGTGSAIGGTIGAVAAAIAAIGTSIALPGLGLVIAGPLAAGLAGAGAGGLAGGLIGALVGSGIPEERAAQYERDVKEGRILMSVKPRDQRDYDYLTERQFS